MSWVGCCCLLRLCGIKAVVLLWLISRGWIKCKQLDTKENPTPILQVTVEAGFESKAYFIVSGIAKYVECKFLTTLMYNVCTFTRLGQKVDESKKTLYPKEVKMMEYPKWNSYITNETISKRKCRHILDDIEQTLF
jgi:hypothetical protein